MLLIRLGLLPVNIGFDVVANQPDTPRYFVATNVRLTDSLSNRTGCEVDDFERSQPRFDPREQRDP